MIGEQSITRARLAVRVGGELIGERVSRFVMTTDIDISGVAAELTYPIMSPMMQDGARITVDLVSDQSYRLITGSVHSIKPHRQRHCVTVVDDWVARRDTAVQLSYIGEEFEVILTDILDEIGIESREISIPAIVPARWSTPTISAERAVSQLTRSLLAFGVAERYRYFVDADGVFRYGTADDVAVNVGELFAFSSTTNIIERSRDTVTTFAYPVRHSQFVTVDNVLRWVTRTRLEVSAARSRLVMTLGEPV